MTDSTLVKVLRFLAFCVYKADQSKRPTSAFADVAFRHHTVYIVCGAYLIFTFTGDLHSQYCHRTVEEVLYILHMILHISSCKECMVLFLLWSVSRNISSANHPFNLRCNQGCNQVSEICGESEKEARDNQVNKFGFSHDLLSFGGSNRNSQLLVSSKITP